LQEENEVALLEHLNCKVATVLVLHHLREHVTVHVLF